MIASNGDLFISEGHNQNPDAPPETVSRISKFTKDGKFIKSFGKFGTGPGEFRGPHDIAMDADGRLFVADRGNMRLQILDQDGKYLGEWKQFSRPSGVYKGLAVDAKGNVYGSEVGPRRITKHVRQ